MPSNLIHPSLCGCRASCYSPICSEPVTLSLLITFFALQLFVQLLFIRLTFNNLSFVVMRFVTMWFITMKFATAQLIVKRSLVEARAPWSVALQFYSLWFIVPFPVSPHLSRCRSSCNWVLQWFVRWSPVMSTPSSIVPRLFMLIIIRQGCVETPPSMMNTPSRAVRAVEYPGVGGIMNCLPVRY